MTRPFHTPENPLLAAVRSARAWALAGAISLPLAMILPAGMVAAQTVSKGTDTKSQDTKAQQAPQPQTEDTTDTAADPGADIDAGADTEDTGSFVTTEGPVALLTELGIYESTYRIAAQLYLEEQRDLARQHLSGPDQQSYDDIVEMLDTYEAPSFEAEHQAFVDAIAKDAPFDQVIEALNNVTEALSVSSFAIGAGLQEEILSMKDLMFLSAIEFENAVDEPASYLSSWGYHETVLRRAEALSKSLEPTWAKAGADVVASLSGVDKFFPELTSDGIGGDPEPLFAAVGQIETIALQQQE